MKKFIVSLMIAAMAATTLAGCGSGDNNNAGTNDNTNNESDANAGNDANAENEGTDENTGNGVSGLISVVSREDGSGTRGAFTELFGILEKDADGNETDMTTQEATIVTSTEVVLTNVAGDPNAIGYVSLGALNDSVKAVKINGVEATVENIQNGSYEISRPFNIATNGEPTGVTADFINFIMSEEGQAVVSEDYIQAVDSPEPFESTMEEGTVVVAGSSSVSPLMQKLIEAYEAINPNAEIDLQTSDSTTGLQYTMDGTADIGMASRELKDSESSLTAKVIAIDGIAVIVNNQNTVDDMTPEEVKAIFTGEKTTW